MPNVRIIGGVYRSRLVSFNNDTKLRPTPDSVRETLFNWLGQDLTNKTCLDLFAGSGVLSFEAVSRGAKLVISVDKSVKQTQNITKNKNLLNIANNLEIITMDAIYYLTKTTLKFDLIFLDPPYNSDLLLPCLDYIQQHALLTSSGTIYVETNKPIDYPLMKQIRQKSSGMVYYSIYKNLNDE